MKQEFLIANKSTTESVFLRHKNFFFIIGVSLLSVQPIRSWLLKGFSSVHAGLLPQFSICVPALLSAFLLPVLSSCLMCAGWKDRELENTESSRGRFSVSAYDYTAVNYGKETCFFVQKSSRESHFSVSLVFVFFVGLIVLHLEVLCGCSYPHPMLYCWLLMLSCDACVEGGWGYWIEFIRMCVCVYQWSEWHPCCEGCYGY